MPRHARASTPVAVFLALAVATSPAVAETAPSITSAAGLDAALAARSERSAETLATVKELLDRDDVRLAARAAGLEPALSGGQAPIVKGGTGSNFPILYALILLALVAVLIFA